MDITKMSIQELKALAFDLIQQRDQFNQNLTQILQQIQSKQQNTDKKRS